MEYAISGGGGAEPYPLLYRGRADLYRDTAFPVYHYLTIDVSDHRLHAVMWKVKDLDCGHAHRRSQGPVHIHRACEGGRPQAIIESSYPFVRPRACSGAVPEIQALTC